MISFKGFDQKILTFKVASAIDAGTPVKISANSTVAKAGANVAFVGIVSSSSDDAAGVIMGGYVELPYSGDSAPALGTVTVAADGNGGITAASTGRTVTVLTVDTTAKTVGIIL